MLSNEPQVIERMMKKALDFPAFQNEYYSGKKNDEDATMIATQPFWQSMRLSKRRMQKHGLVIEEVVKDEPGTFIRTQKTGEDGNNFVGAFKRRIQTRMNIYKDGKKIYSDKNHKLSTVDFIKAKVEGNKAICPNCGGEGLIASFIDGCDYCGSKFSVRDFEEKVSSYSTEENAAKKTGNALKRVLVTSLLLFIVSCIIVVIAFAIAIGLMKEEMSLMQKTNASILAMGLSMIIPVIVQVVFYFGILAAIMALRLRANEKGRIVNEKIVEKVIPNFVVSDFAENLEYKLRNIHMAENAGEVNVFADFDLTESVNSYQDVIECYMTRLEFVSADFVEDKYIVNANVTMRVSRICGKRIKTENEVISITLSLKKGCMERRIGAISRYSCAGCGSNVSLLNGGVCEFCQMKLDYENYSFLINSYHRIDTIKNPYQFVRLKLIRNYAIIFLIAAAIAGYNNEYKVYMLFHAGELVTATQEIFDKVDTLENIDSSVELVRKEAGFDDRTYQYRSENAAEAMESYAVYLEAEGFEISRTGAGYVEYCKLNDINERLAGFYEIKIELEENHILITYELDEVDKWEEE